MKKKLYIGMIIAAMTGLVFAIPVMAAQAESAQAESSEGVQLYEEQPTDDVVQTSDTELEDPETEDPEPVIDVVKQNGTWVYTVDGVADYSYTGFAENSSGSWYIENGKVTFKKQGILKDATGALGEKDAWYYVIDSKVQTGYTGVTNYSNSNGWWYVVDGKVDFNIGTVVKIDGVWRYVYGNTVNYSYTGIAPNENGWWYLDNGEVIFDDALTAAAKFVGQHTSTSQSASSKLNTCYNYMVSHYHYKHYYESAPDPSTFAAHALDYFSTLTGNCYRYAISSTYIAKVLGYETRTVLGKRNGTINHSLCEIKMNGTWYIFDINFRQYLKTWSQYPYKYQVDNRYTLTISDGKVVWK